MKKICGLIRSAMDKYHMIEAGDRIAVGLSGGKDSVILLYALALIREYYPLPFTLTAITLDPNFGNTSCDYSELTAFCNSLGVKHICRPTQLYNIIFEQRKEKNPCSLCARMRRGILHNVTREAGCNKLALGHHLDDAVQTFYMNLLEGGNIGCFKPVTHLTRKQLLMIRPMILAEESAVISAAARHNVPIVKSKCPVDGCTARAKTKSLLQDLESSYPGLRLKTLGAMQRAGLSGW